MLYTPHYINSLVIVPPMRPPSESPPPLLPLYACMHVCMYTCIYVCIYMYVSACICMYMHAYACICMHMHLYACLCMCIHVTYMYARAKPFGNVDTVKKLGCLQVLVIVWYDNSLGQTYIIYKQLVDTQIVTTCTRYVSRSATMLRT
jgi:hypothetical protein